MFLGLFPQIAINRTIHPQQNSPIQYNLHFSPQQIFTTFPPKSRKVREPFLKMAGLFVNCETLNYSRYRDSKWWEVPKKVRREQYNRDSLPLHLEVEGYHPMDNIFLLLFPIFPQHPSILTHFFCRETEYKISIYIGK